MILPDSGPVTTRTESAAPQRHGARVLDRLAKAGGAVLRPALKPIRYPFQTLSRRSSMLRHFWRFYIRRLFLGPKHPRRQDWRGRYLPALENLSERILPAVTASFIPSAGILTVLGDNLDNTI